MPTLLLIEGIGQSAGQASKDILHILVAVEFFLYIDRNKGDLSVKEVYVFYGNFSIENISVNVGVVLMVLLS